VNDARNVGIAAGIGAIIGAIAGGKKGAAVGATIGGGAQTARVLTSRGEAAEIEKERLLSFRLEKELLNWE
jgi:outer membrane lipoprotein SlyB